MDPEQSFCWRHCQDECGATGRCLKSIQREVERLQRHHKHDRWRIYHGEHVEYDGTFELARREA